MYQNQIEMIQKYWYVAIPLIIWTIVWKGIALWKAASNKSKPWFIIFLLVNTIGILEILYIYWIGEKRSKK